MENLDALCAAVMACEGKDVVDLLGVLLGWCRQHETTLRAAYDDSGTKAHLHRCRNDTAAITHGPRQLLDSAYLAAIVAILRARATAPVVPSVVARGVAMGIHDTSLRVIQRAFRARKTRVLAPNEPFLVAEPPLKAIFGANLNSSPDRFYEQIDSLPTVRLAPADLRPYEVSVTWSAQQILGSVDSAASIAAVLPNAGLHELTWDRFTRDGERRFYGVRPRDPADQRDRILRLLTATDESGAKIAVLPELCVNAALLDDIRAWWRSARNLKLLVAGSHHPAADTVDERRNIAVTMTRKGEVEHHKYNRFDFPDLDDAGAPPRTLRLEDIRTNPARLTVHMSGDWSFVTLICKDLMDPRAVELLVKLRVRLVLVPSCSPKTPAFETRARQLSTDAQSLVIVCNTPAGDDAAAAIFGRPTLQRPLIMCAGTDIPAPVAWILNLDGNLRAQEIA